MDRFPEGRFGIPLSHHAATSGKLAVEGFAPLYLTKHQVSVPEAGMCDYVYTVDVFRMVGAVIPMVFRSRVSGYEITRINGITHPYGFGEDRSIWPGPMCIPKPSSGLFESAVGGKVSVVGDLFVVGWKTYFWNPAAERFDAILTSD